MARQSEPFARRFSGGSVSERTRDHLQARTRVMWGIGYDKYLTGPIPKQCNFSRGSLTKTWVGV
eukprot:378487-Amphidinium_carterae.1